MHKYMQSYMAYLMPKGSPPIFDRLRFFFWRVCIFMDRFVEEGMKQIMLKGEGDL